MAEKKTVVLYPSMGVGHLNSMAQLAKALLRLGGAAVAIAVVDPPVKDAVMAAALARLTAASPSVTVRLIPSSAVNKQHSHHIMAVLDALRAANPALRELLVSLPAAVDALVVDMFRVDALDDAAELDIPAYIFYSSAAGDLAVYFQVPDVCSVAPSSFRDIGRGTLSFTGLPPIRATNKVHMVEE